MTRATQSEALLREAMQKIPVGDGTPECELVSRIAAFLEGEPETPETVLFQRGLFRLHSGTEANWKIECDALTREDVATLAMLIAERVGAFSSVEGVPRGGIRLEEELRTFQSNSGPLLIVDDVCTTGGSLEAQRDGRPAVGYVLFSRGAQPSWVRALFTMADSGGPCQCRPCCEARACGVEMGAWVQP